MRQKVARFVALTSPDRRLLFQAVAMQPALRLALRAVGFRRCHVELRKVTRLATRPTEPGDLAVRNALRAGQLVCAAERFGVLDRNCLIHSLTLWWWLRRRGIDSDVRIGVRRIGDALEAHAWVEHCGTVLGGEDLDGRFVLLASTSDIVARGRLATS